MTPAQRAELRAKATAAQKNQEFMAVTLSVPSRWFTLDEFKADNWPEVLAEYLALCTPETILALLDATEPGTREGAEATAREVVYTRFKWALPDPVAEALVELIADALLAPPAAPSVGEEEIAAMQARHAK